MKAFTITLLIVAGIVLLAPPQAVAATTYVDMDTVFMIYRNYYYSDAIKYEMSDDEVDIVTGEIEKVVDFFWRASNLKVNINVVETMIMDRTLTVEQLYGYGAGNTHPYMLIFWTMDGETSLESDLYDAGYVDGDLTFVVALWTLQKSGPPNMVIGNRSSGQEWGNQMTNPCLGDAIYISIPMIQGARRFQRYGVMTHEIEHGIDQLLGQSESEYGADMTNPDQPSTYPGTQDGGESFKFNNLDGVPVAHWADIYDVWVTHVTAIDADSDGLPDSGNPPLTEATLGSSTSSSDSDSDGLSDLDEMQASYTTIADPMDSDTDDDGTADGSDAYPVYDVDTTIKKGSSKLTVDAAIITSGSQNERYTFIANCNGTRAEHSYDVYMSWRSGELWIAADVTDDAPDTAWYDSYAIDGVSLRIDGEGDGFRYGGEYNYEIYIHPQDDPTRVHVYRFTSTNSVVELSTTAAVTAAWTTTANGYIVEMSIPESVFENNIVFNAGSTLRMQVDSCDRDDDNSTWDLLSQKQLYMSSFKGIGYDSFADFELTN